MHLLKQQDTVPTITRSPQVKMRKRYSVEQSLIHPWLQVRTIIMSIFVFFMRCIHIRICVCVFLLLLLIVFVCDSPMAPGKNNNHFNICICMCCIHIRICNCVFFLLLLIVFVCDSPIAPGEKRNNINNFYLYLCIIHN